MNKHSKDCTDQLEQLNQALQAEIARREQAEQALRESELKFRSIAQSANDAIIAADSRGILPFGTKALKLSLATAKPKWWANP